MARAVIITSYLEYPVDLPGLLRPDDYIVSLDGGYDILRDQGVKPHLLLGDFDSIRSDIPEESGIEILRFPPEKDYTDLELAFRILDPANTPDLLVIGGLGGRLDQTVVNIQMLVRYTDSIHEETSGDSVVVFECDPAYGSHRLYRQIELMDGRNRCFVIHGDGARSAEHRIPREHDSYLSMLPLTDTCSGVTLSGVRYPLENAVMERGASLGVSNEFRAEHAVLRLRQGSLLVIITKMQGAITDQQR